MKNSKREVQNRSYSVTEASTSQHLRESNLKIDFN